MAKKSKEGAQLDYMIKMGLIDKQEAMRLLAENAQGRSSADILREIQADPKKYLPKSAAQRKEQQEIQTGQILLDVLSSQLQQQSQGINQQLQGPAQPMPQVQMPQGDIFGGQNIQLGQGATMPQMQVQPQGLLPPQQQGILGLLQANPQAATFETMQESFPSRFGVPEKEDELKRSELQYKKEYLGLQKEEAARRRKELKLKQTREIRIREFAEKKHGIALDKLNIQNQRLLFNIDEAGKANDYKAMAAISREAKSIADGEEVTDEIVAKAIKRLRVMSPMFNIVYNRAVKEEKTFWGGEKPTLKTPEEVNETELYNPLGLD